MANEELFPLRSEQPEGKDVKRILLQYTRYWYLFLLGTTLALGTAFLYLRYYAVPQYRVYSTLLIKDDKSGSGVSSADALSDLSTFKSTRNINNETQVLNSKSLMIRVINELDLYANYYVKGRIKDVELYGNASPIKVLISSMAPTAVGKAFAIHLKSNNTFELDDYSRNNLTQYSFGQQIKKPYGTFTILTTSAKSVAGDRIIVQFQDIQQVANYYNQNLSIQPINKDASILVLSLVNPIPAKAKDVLTKLIEVYNKEAIEDKNLMATNTLRFLDERLQYLTAGLSGVEKTVEQFKSINGLTDITTQASDYTAQASSYNTQLSEWAIQIDVLESLENYLKNAKGNNATVPSTLGIKDETLMGLITKFNELQLERERMLRTTEPGSVFVQNLDEQLVNLRVNILENLRNIKKGLQITSNNLKASSGQFQSKIRKVPAMERELLEINRQQSIKQNIYSYLLQKREETALSLAATASTARVIDPAMGGDFPISPNGQTTYLMALLLGLGIPFAGIYTRDLLNNKVQTQQDITAVTPTPIIGEIAHNSSKETVVVSNVSRTPIAEMFRLVRTNLHFAAIGKQNLVMLVTSGMSGEGKTFFSINLGASLAITGQRVILLDLDLRNPKVASELKLPDGLGLTNYLVANDVFIDDIIRLSGSVPGMFVISAGSIPPNPAELIMSSKFAHLIQELKERFDYIIIDTPPVGQVADAFTLNSFVDFTLYVVRYGYTQKAQLGIIKNIYKNKTLNHPMIVLNDAKEINGNNYGYGYGYGYGQKKTKKSLFKSRQ
jgi:tyrosine-protein kinase Etk/Wzc